MEVVPTNMFLILNEIIAVQTRSMRTLPARLERAELREYAQMEVSNFLFNAYDAHAARAAGTERAESREYAQMEFSFLINKKILFRPSRCLLRLFQISFDTDACRHVTDWPVARIKSRCLVFTEGFWIFFFVYLF
jgi:hypothetical protein